MTDKPKPKDEAPPIIGAIPPTDEPLKSGKQVEVLCGPHRGSILTMSAADAEAAKDDHWAVPYPADPNATHDPLTDDERAHAVEAATAWAVAQTSPPPDPPPRKPDEGRAMHADHDPDRLTYPTRDQAPPKRK